MGLESGTYIDSLDPTNPVGGLDNAKQGDDHIRLLKSTIQNTFPNLSGAVNSNQADLNLLSGVAAGGAFNLTGGGSLTGTWSDLGSITTVDINGGTADGLVIGGTTPKAGRFTELHTKVGSGVTVASTVTLPTDGSIVHFSGSGTINDFTHITGDGPFYCIADSVFTIAHLAGQVEIPGEANKTFAVGDRFVLVQDGTIWNVLIYQSVAPKDETWEIISSAEASSSANLTFNSGIDSTYDHYVFVGEGIRPATNNVNFYALTSTDGGATWNSSYAQAMQWINSSGTSGVTTGTNTVLQFNQNSIKSGQDFNFRLDAYNPAGATYNKKFFLQSHFYDGTNIDHVQGSQIDFATTDIDAIKFYMSSGNIAAGMITLYGVRNA